MQKTLSGPNYRSMESHSSPDIADESDEHGAEHGVQCQQQL